MTQPFISILITSYNREKFIAEAIESALASVFTDFELLVVDNCSIDNTFEIAKQFERIDSRVKVYQNQENIGQFRNRNLAASRANGLYLKYLDSDDLLYPYGLSILVKAALRYPDAGLLASVVSSEGTPFPIEIQPDESYRRFFVAGSFPSVGPTDLLIKKSAFEAVTGFTIPSYAGTDVEFMLKLAAIYPIVMTEPGVAWYRVHNGQEIHEAVSTSEYEINNFKCWTELLLHPNCPLSRNDVDLAMKKLKRSQLRVVIKRALRLDIKVAYKMTKNLNPTLTDFFRALLR
jgi:glycosyltransferase involved in cell wall biosynthesis